MNRERYIDKYSVRKPHFWFELNNQLYLLWKDKDPLNQEFLMCAKWTPLGPCKFKTHYVNNYTHKGSYLFRKRTSRVYPHQIKAFTIRWWDKENKKILYGEFLKEHPEYRFENKKPEQTT